MRTLLTYLPLAACLVMLLLVCRPMLSRHDKQEATSHRDEDDRSKEIAQLREEVAMLREALDHAVTNSLRLRHFGRNASSKARRSSG